MIYDELSDGEKKMMKESFPNNNFSDKIIKQSE